MEIAPNWMENSLIGIKAEIIKLQLAIFQLQYCNIPKIRFYTAEEWKRPASTDFESADSYCCSCLMDLNNVPSAYKNYALCWFPLTVPGGLINLNALFEYEKILTENDITQFSDARHLRQMTAKKLVQVMEYCCLEPSDELLALSEAAPEQT